jgi:Trypsin
VPWHRGRAVIWRGKTDKIQKFSTSYRAAAVALAAAVLLPAAPPGTQGTQGTQRTQVPHQTGPRPAIGTVRTIGPAAQVAARAFWTPGRMAGATAVRPGVQDAAKGGPPPGTPTATPFRGVPTIGALFYTTGSGTHFCTASVVDSQRGDLIVTAAHCVYAGGYATNIEFVPGYHDGRRPYGAWPVQAVVVARAWRQRHDPDLDFAFLTVVDPGHPGRLIQRVTGGLRLGIGRGYAQWMRLIGYNDATGDPVKCESRSHQLRVSQMVFFCRGFRDGTSGGPWILGFTSRGTGTLFGVIGGYQQGGRYDWASYSPVFGAAALALYRQAEATAARQ